MILDSTAITFPDTSDQKIQSVGVMCSFPHKVPSIVENKIRSTLTQTLESILLSEDAKSIDNYINAKNEIESRIIEGLNIVFEPKGYQIESLKLSLAEKTEAVFVVIPYGASVSDVTLQIDTRSFHPFWSDRFKSTFAKSEEKMTAGFTEFLVGLPVKAEEKDWAFNLLSENVLDTENLESLFPDMYIEIDIQINETAVVNISINPSEPVAKTLRVRAYSRSMFQLVLDPIKELVSSHSNIVVGIPLSWLEKSKSEIEDAFCRIIAEDPLSRKLQLSSTCNLYFMERDPNAAFLEVKTESKTWNFQAEAMIDIGNDEAPDEFESHTGFMLGDTFECFMVLNFFPDDIRFRPEIGLGLHPLKDTFLAAAWDINESAGKFYFRQYLSRDTRIEAEVFSENAGQDQYGFVYKPFQFVSFGAFTDGDDDYWLRAAFAF
ncbi:hypothetical protein KKB99_07710 [bacterium]|nr:hypothetical protein [bacterium]MBU1025877.1 hypothetical protein [bacterium]